MMVLLFVTRTTVFFSQKVFQMSVLSRERFELHPAESAKPKYEQLKNFVLAELNSGRLKPGDALPSEPKLANSLQVARNTIRQALSVLEQEGFIERVKGQGTFVRQAAKPASSKGLDAFAIIVPETLGEAFYSPLMNGFEKACSQIHNEMIVRSTSNNPDRQADAILSLLDKKVGGIAMVPVTSVPTPPYQIRQLQQQGVPVVFCHRGVKGVSAPTLAINFRQIGQMAGEQFVKNGHQRIAYLTLIADKDPAAAGYKLGLQQALNKKGIQLQEDLVYRPPNKERIFPAYSYEESVREWLGNICSRKDSPTAIFIPFDPFTEMTMSLLAEMKIKVPEEISLLSFGPKWREMLVTRKLSAIVIDSIQIGHQACELLNEMRNGLRPIDDGQQFEIHPELWEGKTLGPVSARESIIS